MRSRNEELLRKALCGVLRKIWVLRSDLDPSTPDILRLARRYLGEQDLPLYREGRLGAPDEGISSPNPFLDDSIPF